MIKRRFSLIFTFLFLISCLIIPASAAESTYIDLIGNGYVLYRSAGSSDPWVKSDNLTVPANSEFYFPNIVRSSSKIRLVARTSGTVTCNQPISQYTIQPNTYLFDITYSTSSPVLYTGGYGCTIFSAEQYPNFSFKSVSNFTWTFTSVNGSKTLTGANAVSMPLSSCVQVTGTDVFAKPSWINLYIPFDSYTGCDYIDLSIVTDRLKISSLSARSGDFIFPVEVLSISSQDNLQAARSLNGYRVHLSGTSTSDLEICIYFEVGYDFLDVSILYEQFLIQILGIDGGMKFDSEPTFRAAVLAAFDSLRQTLLTLFNPNAEIPDEFKDDVATQETTLDEYKDILDNLTVPDAGDLDADFTDDVNVGDLTLLTGGINTVISEGIFLKLFALSLSLSLVAYILYGKR